MLSLGKRVENRQFAPDALLGQRIAFHAGKKIGDTPSMPATARGFRELACDMVGAGFLAAPVWMKGEEPYLAWQPIGMNDRKSSYILREDDCPKSCIFATARIGELVPPVPAGDCPPWAREGMHWWILEDFKPLVKPIRCSGQRGIWIVEKEMSAEIDRQQGGGGV
jgi:hypothetical protein